MSSPSCRRHLCTRDFISADGSFIVQTECVDCLEFKRKWAAKGDVITEAPMHILLQVQHELACTGLSKAWLVALVGGNRLLRMIVEARPVTQQKLCDAVISFWDSIEDGREPDPDFTEDGDAIAALSVDGDPGKQIDLSANNRAHALCGEYLAWRRDGRAGQGAEGCREGRAYRDAQRRIEGHRRRRHCLDDLGQVQRRQAPSRRRW